MKCVSTRLATTVQPTATGTDALLSNMGTSSTLPDRLVAGHFGQMANQARDDSPWRRIMPTAPNFRFILALSPLKRKDLPLTAEPRNIGERRLGNTAQATAEWASPLVNQWKGILTPQTHEFQNSWLHTARYAPVILVEHNVARTKGSHRVANVKSWNAWPRVKYSVMILRVDSLTRSGRLENWAGRSLANVWGYFMKLLVAFMERTSSNKIAELSWFLAVWIVCVLQGKNKNKHRDGKTQRRLPGRLHHEADEEGVGLWTALKRRAVEGPSGVI